MIFAQNRLARYHGSTYHRTVLARRLEFRRNLLAQVSERENSSPSCGTL